MDAAVVQFATEGIGIWNGASNDQGSEPDVVMACCGDTPTRRFWPRFHPSPTSARLKIRVITSSILMKLQSASEHPHGA